MRFLAASLLALLLPGALSAAAAVAPVAVPKPTADVIRAASPVPGGLFVHAGATDAALAIDMAKGGTWVGVLLADDAATADTLRTAVAKAGLTGQVTVLSGLAATGLPFPGNTVTALLMDGKHAATPAEVTRVLRPDGVLLQAKGAAWERTSKARPKEMDVWAQWHGDATMNDHSNDSLVGQPRSLQWTTGTSRSSSYGLRTTGKVLVLMESHLRRGDGANVLVGRDPFNGARLWESPLVPSSQYAFLMDDERIYFHPESDTPMPMVALDVMTGKEVMRYTEGFSAKSIDMKGRSGKGTDVQWPWPEALLLDGVLVQRFAQTMTALDAKTGKKLWAVTLPGDDLFGYMAAEMTSGKGLLLASEGKGFGSANAYIAGFCRMGLSRIVARDLKTGATTWTWNWSGPTGEHGPEISHLVISGNAVGIAAVRPAAAGEKTPNGEGALGWGYLAKLDLATGKEDYLYTHMERYNSGWMALGLAGHGYFRTYFHDDKQYMVEFSNPRPYDPTTGKLTKPVYSYNFRCHPGRTTPTLAIGSLCIGSFTDDRYYWTEASRSPCDVGTFPANGLLYQAANGCPCFAWLSGDNAFTNEAPPTPITGNRLETGTAKAATAPAGDWPATDAWPMYGRDALRSNWVDTTLAASPTVAWTVKPAPASTIIGMSATEQQQQMLRTVGPIGSPSHAEGMLIVPALDAQAVIGLDPKSGKTTWSITVEGSVDSAPTIYRGLAIFGTSMGWVYAVNRDTGALVWRFYAAPAARTIVANNQAGSAWSVPGTVTILNGQAWVAAGREISMDEGIFWWALDPMTGAIKKQVKTGFSGEWMNESTAPKGKKGRPDLQAGRFGCAATAPTSDGKVLYMQKFGVDTATGEQVDGINDADWWKKGDTLAVRPGMFGIVWAGDHYMGARTGIATCFADRKGKGFAWRGTQFVGLAIRGKGRYESSNTMALCDVTEGGGKPAGYSKDAWSIEIGKSNQVLDANAVAVAGDTVVYVVGKSVCGVNLADGKSKWSLPLPAKGIYGGLSVSAGQVTVVCEDGSVVGIR